MSQKLFYNVMVPDLPVSYSAPLSEGFSHPGVVASIGTRFDVGYANTPTICIPESALDASVRGKLHQHDVLRFSKIDYGLPRNPTDITWMREAGVRMMDRGRRDQMNFASTWVGEKPRYGWDIFDRKYGFRWELHSDNKTIYLKATNGGKFFYAQPDGRVNETPWNWWRYSGYFMTIQRDCIVCPTENVQQWELEQHKANYHADDQS